MRTVILTVGIVATLVIGVTGACQADKCAQHKAMALTVVQHPVDPNHHGGGGHALPFIVGWLAGEQCK